MEWQPIGQGADEFAEGYLGSSLGLAGDSEGRVPAPLFRLAAATALLARDSGRAKGRYFGVAKKYVSTTEGKHAMLSEHGGL